MVKDGAKQGLLTTPAGTGALQFGEPTETRARKWGFWLMFPLLALLLLITSLGAQTSTESTPPADAQGALHAMSRLAEVIFAGRVTAIHRSDERNGAPGIVEIEFSVEDAIRGTDGSSYTMREWASHWSTAEPPFRVGQRYLMLLHAPGPGGLSSPVGGTDGAIPILGNADSAAQSAVASARLASTQTDNSIVDLRWVATRIEQPVSFRVDVLPARPTSPAHPSTVVPTPLQSAADTPAATAPYVTIISTLRTWVRDEDAAR